MGWYLLIYWNTLPANDASKMNTPKRCVFGKVRYVFAKAWSEGQARGVCVEKVERLIEEEA